MLVVRRALINTLLQRGERMSYRKLNHFSGFSRPGSVAVVLETAQAVGVSTCSSDTPLKRCVNEMAAMAKDSHGAASLKFVARRRCC